MYYALCFVKFSGVDYAYTVLYVRSKKAKEPDITIGFLLRKYFEKIYYLSPDLVIKPAIKPKNIAAEIPAAALLSPPVRIPRAPSAASPSFTP